LKKQLTAKGAKEREVKNQSRFCFPLRTFAPFAVKDKSLESHV